MLTIVFSSLIAALIGFIVCYLWRKNISEKAVNSATVLAKQMLEDAKKNIETKRKEALVEAKEEIHKLRTDFDKETKERRADLQRSERRLEQKEITLDKKMDTLEKKEEQLLKKDVEIEKLKEKANEALEEQRTELQRIAEMTNEEARNVLLAKVEKEIRHESALLIKEIEQQTKEEAEKKAKGIISLAIQRCAADHVAETTVSVVNLPTEEMKGRIIGREGRNIRTLENLTGIELIVDDTPEAVILSGFDPVRREIARIALEKLIVDGRIHPARIEEMVDKAKKEVEQTIKESGEQAVFEVGVHGLHPEIIKLLGRLRYRTSYGQNVLKHSVEVAHLAGILADELGVDAIFAKRAALLHDIGKAVDHEIEGSHIEIAVNLAKKYRESAKVINAIAAHHGDEEPLTVEAVLIIAADAISAARPGARRETLETYLKRLTKLEEIANACEGVEKTFAVQAGREVRIIVKPEKVDDLAAVQMAREVSKRIENELNYPGQIRVTVIRETRAVDYAK